MNYVLGFGQERDQRIVFVRKKSPEWQKGKLNLPGGKIEIGEGPKEALFREYQEETGYFPETADLYGKIEGSDFNIWCYKLGSLVRDLQFYCEDVEAHSWYKAQRLSALIGNLRIVIPLMLSGTRNWLLQDYVPEKKREDDTHYYYNFIFRDINTEIKAILPDSETQAKLLGTIKDAEDQRGA